MKLRLGLALSMLSMGCASSSDVATGGAGSGTSPNAASNGSPVSSSTATVSSTTGTGGSVPCGMGGETCCAGFACDGGLVCDGTTCGAAIAAFDCTGHAGAVFVSEVAPPATMAPWQTSFASVTFANCGPTPWTSAAASAPTGVKLGASTPHDDETWAANRIALPADVPVGSQVTVAIAVHALPLTGPHSYGFELVDEGVAWLGVASPAHTIDIETSTTAPIALCSGQMADPGGATSATAALQACIDATPSGGTLALPAGIYRMTDVVHIDKPMTLTTDATSTNMDNCLDHSGPSCAVLRADENLSPSGARGFLRLGSLLTQVSSVTLDHVLVDGNRGARLGSTAAQQCASGNNGEGINIGASCASCTMVGMASARALCGTGLEWDGDGITVDRSVFFGNGDHETQNMWSDGLTIHKSDNAMVTGSRFVDNSDVGFISGGGIDSQYTGNSARQIHQASFAALMLDNFDNGAIGNFTGTMLANNVVVCPAGCHFGIELGPHPWYASPNIIGGTVTGNTVVGAHIEINAQGAGTVAAPTVISGNTLGPVPGTATFNCGAIDGCSPLNVSPESHVDLQGGSATGSISVPCP